MRGRAFRMTPPFPDFPVHPTGEGYVLFCQNLRWGDREEPGMADRSLGGALADIAGRGTTLDGIDGLPREPSFGVRAEEQVRRWWRRTGVRKLRRGPFG